MTWALAVRSEIPSEPRVLVSADADGNGFDMCCAQFAVEHRTRIPAGFGITRVRIIA